MAVCRIYWYC